MVDNADKRIYIMMLREFNGLIKRATLKWINLAVKRRVTSLVAFMVAEFVSLTMHTKWLTNRCPIVSSIRNTKLKTLNVRLTCTPFSIGRLGTGKIQL